MSDVRDLIAAEAEASEESRHDPLPADAVGTRRSPGVTSPRVLSVRLDAEVFADLSAQADRMGTPVSTLARMLIVRGLGSIEVPDPQAVEILSTLLADQVRNSVRSEVSHLLRPEFLRDASG
ncbi:hypothetical protein [Isoptericola aurantiacus]|uniref:hypothetical protein n=1 Tax=Isoptericola aurantiacus TaxID=3377839 RepID=UPI00383B5CFA